EDVGHVVDLLVVRDVPGIGHDGACTKMWCRTRTKTSSPTTPTVIAESARLNVGQCGSVRKSTTPPLACRATRSTSLLSPPPKSSPMTTDGRTGAARRAHIATTTVSTSVTAKASAEC